MIPEYHRPSPPFLPQWREIKSPLSRPDKLEFLDQTIARCENILGNTKPGAWPPGTAKNERHEECPTLFLLAGQHQPFLRTVSRLLADAPDDAAALRRFRQMSFWNAADQFDGDQQERRPTPKAKRKYVGQVKSIKRMLLKIRNKILRPTPHKADKKSQPGPGRPPKEYADDAEQILETKFREMETKAPKPLEQPSKLRNFVLVNYVYQTIERDHWSKEEGWTPSMRQEKQKALREILRHRESWKRLLSPPEKTE
ncbi:MAG TPA: hypothetical protein VG206_13905 [Terriglobia bacterium]|nr:hypothetical protein [Terriglobia bacterium]